MRWLSAWPWRKVAGLTLVVGLAVALWFALRPTVVDVAVTSAQLDSAVRAAKAVGIPWTSDELAAMVNVRGTENALGHFQAAADMLHFDRDSSPNAFLSYNISQVFLQAEMTRQSKALAELRLAASMPKIDFRRDWDLGTAQPIPEYSEARDCTKLLCASALLGAMSARPKEAVRDLVAARHVARLTAQDPTVRGLNAALLCDAIALATAVRCMAFSAGSETELTAYRDQVLGAPFTCDLATTLRGEAYVGIATIRNLEALGGWRSAYRAPRGSQIDNPVRTGVPGGMPDRAFLVRHLQFWTAAVQAAEPYPADTVAAASEVVKATSGFFRLPGLSLAMITQRKDDLGFLRNLAAQTRAIWVVDRVLVETLVYRAAKGRYPARLEELGQLPTDPLSGRPLRYRVDGGTVRIWSVGADGRDEGGLTRQERGRAAGNTTGYDDVLASYPPPKENSSVF